MAADRSGCPPAITWHRAADIEEIGANTVKAVSVAGVDLVLIRSEDRYGALSSRCPHAGGPLGEGTLEDGYLVCPWHGREYDPVNGACEGYAEAVRAYPVEVRTDGIYVAL